MVRVTFTQLNSLLYKRRARGGKLRRIHVAVIPQWRACHNDHVAVALRRSTRHHDHVAVVLRRSTRHNDHVAVLCASERWPTQHRAHGRDCNGRSHLLSLSPRPSDPSLGGRLGLGSRPSLRGGTLGSIHLPPPIVLVNTSLVIEAPDQWTPQFGRGPSSAREAGDQKSP